MRKSRPFPEPVGAITQLGASPSYRIASLFDEAGT